LGNPDQFLGIIQTLRKSFRHLHPSILTVMPYWPQKVMKNNRRLIKVQKTYSHAKAQSTQRKTQRYLKAFLCVLAALRDTLNL
jgi:hypothetical protein